MIREMQAEGELDADAMEAFDYVIFLLSSTQLYTPQQMPENLDVDVDQWLKAMLKKGGDGQSATRELPVVSPERALYNQLT